jgi:FlaG/FlaF family flagellin (archaellin)
VSIIIVAVIIIASAVVYSVLTGRDSDSSDPLTGAAPPTPTDTTSTEFDPTADGFAPVSLSNEDFREFADTFNDFYIHGVVDIYAVTDDGGCGQVDGPSETYEAMYSDGKAIDYGFLDRFDTEQDALKYLDNREACWLANGQSVSLSYTAVSLGFGDGDVNVLTLKSKSDGASFHFVQYANIALYYTGGTYADDPQGIGKELRSLVLELFR